MCGRVFERVCVRSVCEGGVGSCEREGARGFVCVSVYETGLAYPGKIHRALRNFAKLLDGAMFHLLHEVVEV